MRISIETKDASSVDLVFRLSPGEAIGFVEEIGHDVNGVLTKELVNAIHEAQDRGWSE